MSKYVTLYHGSNNRFNKFENKYISSNVGTSGAGPGFYFTPDIKEAIGYGKYIYECELKLGNSLNNEKLEAFKTIHSVKKLLYDMYNKFNSNYYENYGYQNYSNIRDSEINSICLDLINYSDSDTDLISGIFNSGSLNYDQLFNILHSLNYNHTKDGDHIIMYQSKDIKIKNIY